MVIRAKDIPDCKHGRRGLCGECGQEMMKSEDIGDNDERLVRARAGLAGLDVALGEARLGVEELEILVRYIPKDLMQAYIRLVDAMVGEKALGSGRGYDENDMGLGGRSGVVGSSGSPLYRGGAARNEKPTSAFTVPIRSEAAVDYRGRLDRRLRNEARKLKSFLADNDERVVLKRRCSGKCKRLGDAEWLYCPHCAGPMIDVEPPDKKRKIKD